MMQLAFRRVFASAALCAVAFLPSVVQAQTRTPDALLPNGNGINSPSAPFVRLLPNPAVYQSLCSNMNSALTNATLLGRLNTPTQKWNFTFAAPTTNLNLNFTLNTYQTYQDGDSGGADFKITYNAGAAPQPPNVAGTGPGAFRWIQVTYTNANVNPNGMQIAVPAGGGFVNYLDAAGGNYGNPWYGNLSGFATATGTTFEDTPGRELIPGTIWESQVFVAQDLTAVAAGVTTNNVTIYNGVFWGFQVVPEPGLPSLALAALGAAQPLLLIRRRRRAAQQSKRA